MEKCIEIQLTKNKMDINIEKLQLIHPPPYHTTIRQDTKTVNDVLCIEECFPCSMCVEQGITPSGE